jgi:hypothetical protein
MIIIKIITIISIIKTLIKIYIVDYTKAWRALSRFFDLGGLLATLRASGRPRPAAPQSPVSPVLAILFGLRCPKHERDVMASILDSSCYRAPFVADPHQRISGGRHDGQWRRLEYRTNQVIVAGVHLSVRF